MDDETENSEKLSNHTPGEDFQLSRKVTLEQSFQF